MSALVILTIIIVVPVSALVILTIIIVVPLTYRRIILSQNSHFPVCGEFSCTRFPETGIQYCDGDALALNALLVEVGGANKSWVMGLSNRSGNLERAVLKNLDALWLRA